MTPVFIFASRFYSFVQHRCSLLAPHRAHQKLGGPSTPFSPQCRSAVPHGELCLVVCQLCSLRHLRKIPPISVETYPTGLHPKVEEVSWIFFISSTGFYAWLITSGPLPSRYMCDWWTSSVTFVTAPAVSKVLPVVSVSTRQTDPPSKYWREMSYWLSIQNSHL